MKRLLLACVLPVALSACGVPDIIAHGGKEIDRGNQPQQVAPASAPAGQHRPAPAVMREEPPPVAAPSPVAPRESITVETLPAQ